MNCKINIYPTQKQIKAADRYNICRWQRFLRPPENDTEIELINLVFARFKELGGMTPGISKSLGW
jgi:hypothetical protein